jgi:hypothetical protein
MHIGYKSHQCCYNNLHGRHRPITAQMPAHRHPQTCLDQISTRWFTYERSDEISTQPNPIQSVQKKIKPRVESNMVATRIGSTTLRRCLRAATSRQRRLVTSVVLVTTPSNPVCVEEGGADGIDATTLTSKPIALTPPVPM